MLKLLFINEWRKTIRSIIWTRNVIANILLSLLYLILIANFLTIGLAVNEIFSKYAPGKDPVNIINSGLLFYFLIDIFMRMIFQRNHGFAVKPYLHLPVTRSTLVNYLLSKSFFSIFNFLPLFFVIPFLIKVVLPAHSLITGIAWFCSILAFLLIDCFIVTFIKKSSLKTYKYGIITAVLFVAAVLLDYFKIISISSISSSLFSAFLTIPESVLIPVALFAGVYLVNYRLLIDSFYLENIETQKKIRFRSFKLFDIFEGFGETGKYISLELKLLLRNKRSRSLVFYALAMILIGLLIYPSYMHKKDIVGSIMLIYFGIIITGVFLLTYGQYVFSWESSYFDAIITKKIDFNNYINAKYVLMVIAGCMVFIISLLYGFFGLKIIEINAAAFLYNIGINPLVLLFIATFNRKRFDLTVSMMSQQGRGAGQYLAVIPTILIPTAFIVPFSLSGHQDLALIALSILGIAGLIFHKQLMKLIIKQFYNQKYKMAAGFRRL